MSNRKACYFFILFIISTSSSSQTLWSSWHGGEAQGFYDSEICSDSTKTLWQRPLLGEGHSSPITDGKTLYLTAGFKDQKTARWITIAFNLLFISFLFIILVMIRGLTNLESLNTPFLQKAIYVWILVITFLTFFYGDALFDFHRCSIRRWVVTSILLTLLIASNIFFMQSVKTKRRLGFLLVALGLIVIFFVPSKSHAYRHGLMGTSSLVMYGIGGFPIITGLMLLLYHLWDHSKSFWAKYWKWGMSVLGGLFGIWFFSFVHRVSVENQSVTSELNTASYTPLLDLNITLALFGLGLAVYWAIYKFSSLTLSVISTLINSVFILCLFIHLVEGLAVHFPYFAYQFGSPALETRFNLYHFGTLFLLFALTIVAQKSKPFGPRSRLFHQSFTLLFGLLYFILVNFGLQNSLYNYAVFAFDSQTGHTKWVCAAFKSPRFPVHKDNSLATPTPTFDGKNLYAYFGSVGLTCVDTLGNVIWTNSNILHNTIYGPASSPIIHQNDLFICTTIQDSVIIYAIDKHRGTIRWQSTGPILRGSSGLNRPPLYATVREQEQLLVWGSDSLAGYNPQNGELLWQTAVPVRQMDHVTSILKDKSHIFCIGLDRTTALCKDSLGVAKDPIAWTTRVRGANVPSGIITEEHIIFLTDHGHLLLGEKSTGRIIDKIKLKGLFYASPLATKKNIVCMNTKGTYHIVSYSDSLSVKHLDHLNDPVFASPIPLENNLIIRSKNALYCIAK